MTDDVTVVAPQPLILRDRLALALGVDGETRDEVYRHVAGAATLRDVTYWLEILISAGIAILGLSLDSPAVIIGAMLISPLMNPILAAGMALAASDFILLTRTAVNIAISAIVAILFASFFVILLPFREMTGEIAARLRPTTLDLVVALLSGAIGAIAVGKSVKGVATSIPGVAIAVALMPPLGVVGYGAGLMLTVDRVQGTEVFRGGGLLFLTNLVAIIFSAMLVFLLLHFDAPELRDEIRLVRESDPEGQFVQKLILRYPFPDGLVRVGTGPVRLTIPLIFVVVLFVPLTKSLDKIKTELSDRKRAASVQQTATSQWQENFARSLDGKRRRSSILSLTSAVNTDRVEIRLRVATNEPLSEQERALYVRVVAAALARKPETVVLDLIEIPTSEAKTGLAPPPVVEKIASTGELIASLQARLDPLIARAKFPARARVLSHAVTLLGSVPVVNFRYLADEELGGDVEELIEERVRQLLDIPGTSATFERVPSIVQIRFRDGTSELDEEMRAALEGVANTAVKLATARVAIRTESESKFDRQRSSAVQLALSGEGRITDDRFDVAVSDSLETREVEVSIVLP